MTHCPWSDFFQCRMSTPHILSLCHLQEHSLNFLGKYKYVFVVFSTSFTSLLVFLHLLQSIIHLPACSIHLDFLSIHTVGSYSLAYDASATLKFFGTPPSAKCLFFSPKPFPDLAYGWSSPVSCCFFISWRKRHTLIYCYYYFCVILGKLC